MRNLRKVAWMSVAAVLLAIIGIFAATFGNQQVAVAALLSGVIAAILSLKE